MSVQSVGVLCGEIGKDFCPNLIRPFLENIDRRSRNDGSRALFSQYLTTLTEKAALSSDDDSDLGVPCRGALLGRAEWEGEKQTFGSNRFVNIWTG